MSTTRLQQIRAMLAESPTDSFLLFALAKEYEKLGQTEEALEQYEHLKAIDPGYVGLYYHLGKLLESRHRLEEALQVYRSGMEVADRAGDLHAKQELAAARLNLEDF